MSGDPSTYITLFGPTEVYVPPEYRAQNGDGIYDQQVFNDLPFIEPYEPMDTPWKKINRIFEC